MYTRGCTKSGAVYVLCLKHWPTQDMNMHAWSIFCSKYFASNDERSLAVSGQCMFDVKTHPATSDVKMGKLRQSILLRLQKPCARGK